MLDREARHLGQVDEVGRRVEAVGLDPRQAHQILDDPQHAPRLAADRLAEAAAQRVVHRAILGQRFGITDDRRQRGAQFVAGIGDEVGPHPLGRLDRRPVGQPHQRRAIGERARAQVPRAVGRADPDDVDFGLARRDRIMSSASGWRMAKRRSRPMIASPSSARAARLAASVRWARTISAGSAIASRMAAGEGGNVGHGPMPSG